MKKLVISTEFKRGTWEVDKVFDLTSGEKLKGAPIAEHIPDFSPVFLGSAAFETGEYDVLQGYLNPLYGRLCADIGARVGGPFGDYLTVIESEGVYYLTEVGLKAWPKPAIASDLFPVIFTPSGKIFFVGIKRGQAPGIGLPASLGGFNGVFGPHLASSPECLLGYGKTEKGEAREEIGMKVWVNKEIPFDTETPFPDIVAVKVKIGQKTYDTSIYSLGETYTTEEEYLPNLNEQRVHAAWGYLMPVVSHKDVTREELLAQFKCNDPKEGNGIYVQEITAESGFELPLPIGHHKRLWKRAVQMLETFTTASINPLGELFEIIEAGLEFASERFHKFVDRGGSIKPLG